MQTLAECIADNFDDAMKAYTTSDDYKQSQQNINTELAQFRESLTEHQKVEFNHLINLIGDDNSALLTRAYTTGVIDGIALRNEYQPRN